MVRLLAFGLATALFTIVTRCETEFIRPANYEPYFDSDVEDNLRYDHGSTITVKWRTDLKLIDLCLFQARPDGMSAWGYLARNLTNNYVTWRANFDIGIVTEDDEDASCWFVLYDPVTDEKLAESQGFNISAPESALTSQHVTPTAPTGPIFSTFSSSTTTSATTTSIQSETTSTYTGPEPNPESDIQSDLEPDLESDPDSAPQSSSGLTKGATAGIATGAVLGGLLLIGTIAFLVRRRIKKSAKSTEESGEFTPSQQQIPNAMAELPGHPVTQPDYGRNSTVLHEAP